MEPYPCDKCSELIKDGSQGHLLFHKTKSDLLVVCTKCSGQLKKEYGQMQDLNSIKRSYFMYAAVEIFSPDSTQNYSLESQRKFILLGYHLFPQIAGDLTFESIREYLKAG